VITCHLTEAQVQKLIRGEPFVVDLPALRDKLGNQIQLVPPERREEPVTPPQPAIDFFSPLENQVKATIEKLPDTRLPRLLSLGSLYTCFPAYSTKQIRDALDTLDAQGFCSMCRSCRHIISKRTFHLSGCQHSTT
jgi:hypothetical protein